MHGKKKNKHSEDFSEFAKERRAERKASAALKQSKKMDLEDQDDVDTIPELHRNRHKNHT